MNGKTALKTTERKIEKDGARAGRGSLEGYRVNRGNVFAHLREHVLDETVCGE